MCLPQNRNNKNKNNKQTVFSSMSEDVKMSFFESQKLKPEIASIYQFALPIPFVNLGFSYSDNWKKGAYIDVALLALIAARDDFKNDQDCKWYGECSDASDMEMAIGFVVLYKVFKSNQLAEKYNKKLFKKLFGVRKPNFSFNYSSDKKYNEFSVSFPLN
tara:strand:+ start:2054 stop:2533 length:480 start_codon:yes stop_codon:yes gene_type:complete